MNADADVAADEKNKAVHGAAGVKVVFVVAIPADGEREVDDEERGVDGGDDIDGREALNGAGDEN